MTAETTINTPTMRPALGSSLTGISLCCALLFSLDPAYAQLPAPGRTIYKCQVKGKVSYSDEPCIGAQRLDVVPSRGADRLSGTARSGKDVAAEIRSEQFAASIRPLTGMTPAQLATATRRHHLSAGAKRECGLLESVIIESEQAEQGPRSPMMESVQQDLFILRKRYKKLGC